MSSAKSLMQECMSLTMSLIKTRKRRGAMIDPCGPPAFICFQEEAAPGSTTLCLRPAK